MIQRQSAVTGSVNLHSIQTNKFKTGVIAFTVSMPSGKLHAPYSLILAKMLERATKSYPSRLALSRRVDDLYVSSTDIRRIGFGKNVILSFSAEILDEKYCKRGANVTKDVCALLKEYMLSPLLDEDGLFPKAAFEQEKRRSANALRAIINSPASYASLRLSELLNRDNPDTLPLEDAIEAVEKCDREMLTKFYIENVCCQPIDVYYVGTLSHEEIADKLSLVLGDYVATKKEALIPLGSTNEPRETVRKNETMPLSQGRLGLGFRLGVRMTDEDYCAALLFDELFGGSPSSKLFVNVREKRSLCYSCGSRYSSTTGYITASAGISPQNREITEEAILLELENVKAGKITKTEFEAAKKSLLNSIRETYDNPTDILEYYLYSNTANMSLTLDEYLARVSLLKKEDVIRVASRAELDCIYFLCGEQQNEENEE